MKTDYLGIQYNHPEKITLLCILKLNFDHFDLEESEHCQYDSLTVFGDINGEDEIGNVQKHVEMISFDSLF